MRVFPDVCKTACEARLVMGIAGQQLSWTYLKFVSLECVLLCINLRAVLNKMQIGLVVLASRCLVETLVVGGYGL